MKKILALIALFVIANPSCVFAATSYDTYAWQKFAPTGINTTAAASQIQLLTKEVTAITSKGALAPLVMHYADQPDEGYLLYQDRGRIIQTLAYAYPFVDATTQTQIKTYVKNMLSSGDENFMTNKLKSPAVGVQRRLHGDSSADTVPTNVFTNISALHLIYGMWAYGDRTGDWTTIQSYWPALKTFYANNKSTNVLYGDLAGYLAMARLAKQFADTTTLSSVESDITTQFGQALNPSTVETRAKGMMYAYFYDSRKAEYFPGQPWMYLNTSPEIMRFIGDNATLKTDYTNRLNQFGTEFAPWWLNQLPTFNRWTGDEGIGATPELMNLYFNRERYINKQSATQLSEYMRSIPTGIGDIFWIEALVGSIEAYGQDCWENLSTTTIECAPNATVAPTATPTADTCPTDINLDKVTDISDYSILVANFFSPSPAVARADVNKDGIVDLTDYSQLVGKFLQSCP